MLQRFGEFVESLAKVSPWITVVMPSLIVIGIGLIAPSFITVIVPASLVVLFAILSYSIPR